jgi:hypothetical protein
MVQYLILGVALLVAVIFIARWFESANPTRLAKALKWGFLGLGGLLAVYFGVTGRIQLALIPLALTVLPAIIRGMRGAAAARQGGTPSPGKQSEVETAYLRMLLDHDSGDMDGTILRGEHAGRNLRELTQAQLLDLLEECRIHDEQSARLIESYIDRAFGDEWRGAEGSSGGKRARHGGANTMDREEAYDVLGLEPDSSAAEIRDAHHKLLLKIHPDQGGSDYLAAKINQAKEVLLNDK